MSLCRAGAQHANNNSHPSTIVVLSVPWAVIGDTVVDHHLWSCACARSALPFQELSQEDLVLLAAGPAHTPTSQTHTRVHLFWRGDLGPKGGKSHRTDSVTRFVEN